MILSTGQLLAMGTLSELRQQADLPVVIKPSGLNGSVAQDLKLNTFLTNRCQNTLLVPEQEKLAVLKQLLSLEGLDDIHVESANLEQVYQHFLEKHELLTHKPAQQQTQGEKN
jgi:Cu-processing system ATP-binding protein